MKYGALTVFLGLALALPVGAAGEEEAGWLGVLLGDAVDGGVEVVALVPGGPADGAGLKRGDVVIQIDSRPMSEVEDLALLLNQRRPGDRVRLELLRSGRRVRREVELGLRPAASPFPVRPPAVASAPSLPAPPTARAYAGLAGLGIEVTDVTPDLRRYYGAPDSVGVLVTSIDSGRPAEAAGFRVGDLVLRLGEAQIERVEQLEEFLETVDEATSSFTIELIRGRQPTVLTLDQPVRFVAVPAAAAPPAPEAVSSPGVSPSLELALEQEMGRLREQMRQIQQRLEILSRQLEALDDER